MKGFHLQYSLCIKQQRDGPGESFQWLTETYLHTKVWKHIWYLSFSLNWICYWRKWICCNEEHNPITWSTVALTNSRPIIYQQKGSMEASKYCNLEEFRWYKALYIRAAFIRPYPQIFTRFLPPPLLSVQQILQLLMTSDDWQSTWEQPVIDSSCCWTENYYHLFKKMALDAAISERNIG